jgi:nitrate/TMAO reductase-like tetraheme cytochrome c subunit
MDNRCFMKFTEIPRRAWRVTLTAVLLLLIGGAPARAYTAAQCRACHGASSTRSARIIDIGAFEASAHAEQVDCTDCHSGIVDETHTTLSGSGAVDCAQCHDQVNRHGAGANGDPVPRCHDCHTRHAILPPDNPRAATHRDNLAQTCGRCHPAQSGREDYLSWLPSLKVATHAKGDSGDDYGAQRCLGCHQGRGSHGQPEIVDAEACDRCHLTPDGRNVLLGYFHPRADLQAQPGVFAAGVLYQLLWVGLLGAGLVFYARKFSGRP